MSIQFDLNSQAITDMATFLQSDLYTAAAHVIAPEFGIKEAEMPIYLDLFKDFMNKSFTAEKSIQYAIEFVVRNPTLTTELNKNYNQKP